MFLMHRAQGGSYCPCLCPVPPVSLHQAAPGRLLEVSLPGTERWGLGLGCRCNDFHPGLGEAVQDLEKNIYAPQRDSLSQQISAIWNITRS